MNRRKPLSTNMVKTLRYVRRNGSVEIAKLRGCMQATIWALLKRKLLMPNGEAIMLTEHGEEIVMEYSEATLIQRKHLDDLSQRVARLLHVGRAFGG